MGEKLQGYLAEFTVMLQDEKRTCEKKKYKL